MTINIANAPCSWGVDYAEDINNPSWKDVFIEISKSFQGVIRGFHGDNKTWKLITCLQGKIKRTSRC